MEFKINICGQCYRLDPGTCHDPTCVFIWRTREEVSEYLDMLMIRPKVDGVQLDLMPERRRKKLIPF